MCFAILASQPFQCDTVLWKTFEGENFREFQDFAAIREIFLFEIWGSDIFCGTNKKPMKVSRYNFYGNLSIFTCLQFLDISV